MASVLGWWFVPSNRRPQHGEHSEVVPGQVHTHSGELAVGRSGLHASRRALDAFRLAGGATVACRVRLVGELVEGRDQMVAHRREVMWCADAEAAMLKLGQLCRALVEEHAPALTSMPADMLELALVEDGDALVRAKADSLSRVEDARWLVEQGKADPAALDRAKAHSALLHSTAQVLEIYRHCVGDGRLLRAVDAVVEQWGSEAEDKLAAGFEEAVLKLDRSEPPPMTHSPSTLEALEPVPDAAQEEGSTGLEDWLGLGQSSPRAKYKRATYRSLS